MKTLIYICFAFGILNVYASETNKPNKMTTTKQITDDTIQAVKIAKDVTNDATKDKRQTKDTKDAATAVYANHRSDTAVSANRNSNTNSDDPEDPQETIYGTNARQFLIRPQHQQQQNEEEQQQHLLHEHQPPQQLRNYAATIRPHSTQLLEQSQEIQHYAYLQDLNRNQQKGQTQGKSQSAQSKKSSNVRAQSQQQSGQAEEEAEQRYAVAVEQPIPQNHPRAHIYRPQIPYHVALQQQQLQQQERDQQRSQQSQQQQQQQQYQIIPEEQFLKILQEELHARQAYHDDQVRRQQTEQQQSQQHRQQQQQQNIQRQQQSAAAAASQKVALQSQGLGNYRQRIESEDERDQPEYVQYVQRSRAGPKYLPLPQGTQQEEQSQPDPIQQHPLPQLPPQIAYYQPQISYKTLPNHPLAKSSLEKEIEKLLAINTPDVAPVQIVDNSNEPSALINHHHHHGPPGPQSSPRSHTTSKAYIPSTAAPKRLLENNNQPFLPSLFQYSGFQQPTQNYPTQVPQQVIDAKKLGPVVYPQQSPAPSIETPVQASQFYYQDAAPSPRPKAYRPKYGTKFATTPTPIKPHQNDINYPVHSKYSQPVLYEIERPSPTAGPGPTHFYPSPPDPHRNIPSPPTAPPTPAVTTKYSPTPTDFRQFALPGPSPSQSSIYVSQGTGIVTPSRPVNTVKPKTVDDLKQLHLPQPGGKPLTQTEFQALVDAGYPVTAVPVPVPIPYEQYIKDHPDYRNQPPPQAPALPVNYEHLMRFAQLQQHHQQVPQYGPHRGQQQLQHARSLVQRPSEHSVKIISSASEPQTATAIGGGSITYLRSVSDNQKRRPRDETETKVLGAKEEEKVEVKQVEDKNEKL